MLNLQLYICSQYKLVVLDYLLVYARRWSTAFKTACCYNEEKQDPRKFAVASSKMDGPIIVQQ